MMANNKYIPERLPNRVVLERSKIRDSMLSPDSIEGGTDIGSGLLTAFQTLAISLLCVLIPVVSTTAVSTTLLDQDFDAGSSLLFGLKAWSLGHGGSFVISDSTVSLVPLGLTLIFFLVSKLSVRRSLRPTLLATLTYTISYLAVLLLVVALVDATGAAIARALLVTALFLVLSVKTAFARRPDSRYLRDASAAYFASTPVWFRYAFRSARNAILVACSVAAVACIGWLFLGRDSMALVLDGWTLDALSNLAFVFAQVLYLPNLVLWALNWLSGTGFSIGAGTIISPHEVVLGPLPSIPLLGSLPQSAAPTGFSIVFIALVAFAGFVGGWRASKQDESLRWWHFLVIPLFSGTVVFATLCLVNWCNYGEIGGGQNYTFGPTVILSSAVTAGVLALGVAISFLLLRAEPRAALVQWFGSARKTEYVVPELSENPTHGSTDTSN